MSGFGEVYDELRASAGEPPGHTLDATALVHEAHRRVEFPPVRSHRRPPAGV